MLRPVLLFALTTLTSHAQSADFRWVRQLGGAAGQAIAGMATDPQGNIYVAGNTTSVDFPVRGAIQPHPAGSGIFRVDGPGAAWKNLYQAGATAAYALAVDPRAPNKIYAGTATGLLRSRDSGESWTPAISFGVRVNALTVDPANSGVVYAASQGQGFYKSLDSGFTWLPINNGVPADSDGRVFVFGIWIDPHNSAVLLAASSVGGLLRSTDSGASWTVIISSVVPLQVSSVAFDPVHAGVVYATESRLMVVSKDDGLTWNPLGQVELGYQSPTVILPDPTHENVLYASSDSALWKSADAGATWQRKIDQFSANLTLDHFTNAIYAVLGARLVVTTDGFDTTTPIGPLIFTTLVTLAAGGGRVFVGAQSSTDIFVAKLDPDGNTIFATYFGGSATDLASALGVDSAGGVYVTGTTQSLDFPFSAGAFSGAGRAFLFKLNPDGSLAYATGLQGGTPNAIAVDAAGRAVVTGVSSGDLPVTPGAWQTKFLFTFCGPGCQFVPPPTNAFVAEFDSAGASLVFATYLGSETESAAALTLTPDGSIVVAGKRTLYQLDSSGSSLLRSKSLPADIRALSTDARGNILAAGSTQDALFPTTPGAFQTTLYRLPTLPGTLGNTGSGDVFVTRLDSELNILNSTLLAGEASEIALSVEPSASGNIIVGGSTYSQGFPSHGPVQSPFSPTTGFLSQLTPDLSALVFSTFTGDNRPFFVRSVAATPDGGVVLAGSTSQPPFFNFTALFPDTATQAYVVRADPTPSNQPNPAPRIDRVVNAASQLASALSPRETIQVRGDFFDAEAALYLNGDALPLQSHDRTTLIAAVPTELSMRGAATIQVRAAGGTASILVPTAAASPGVFSRDATGSGQGYILNKDGSLNSPDNPAAEGEPITICATGVGSMTFDHDYAVTDAVVDVRVDGFSAAGIAAVLGPAPGLPGDVYQISVYVPHPVDFVASNPNLKDFVMPPQVGVTLIVNGVPSQAGIALSVGNR
uniref:Glycosyl hydrolase, BNR repeat-containing protein n=1 Tax=Solibacter usitatus (strain Ellin6076) TaxID=234267 RepID=Q02D71_SOLUE